MVSHNSLTSARELIKPSKDANSCSFHLENLDSFGFEIFVEQHAMSCVGHCDVIKT